MFHVFSCFRFTLVKRVYMRRMVFASDEFVSPELISRMSTLRNMAGSAFRSPISASKSSGPTRSPSSIAH